MHNSPPSSRFAELVADHTPLIRKIARSFSHCDADHDDLTQEILLTLWRNLESFRSESRLSTFIYRIAINKAISWQRKRNTYRNHLLFFSRQTQIKVHTPSIDRTCDPLDQLYQAIRRLKDADRSLVLLQLEGLSYTEIAEILEISEKNVGVRLSRARQKLRDDLTNLKTSSHKEDQP